MFDEHTTYDLGEIGGSRETRQAGGAPAATLHAPLHFAARPVRHEEARTRLCATASMFVPGTGHLIRREFSAGFFYLTLVAFLGAACWAVVATMPRLTQLLVSMDQPRGIGTWILGALYVAAAVVYLTSVASTFPVDAVGAPPSTHPVAAALASVMVPGWGQLLNGHRGRAVLLLAGLWLAAGAWVLSSAPFVRWLDSMNLYLPPALAFIASSSFRWSLTAVIWSLGVYDAAVWARRH